ncbi:hypothetical protein KFL_001410240 [Klebsormidium nitens]|uniref:Uncharacterized protein n=1 Tax=Klebsormidium nitens TaxID=105231 RepID=A0A0U9HKJ5_KLENI|nr:hypothetical protein KFL_001410240 [Klebsormidium nitens]|eukprot:GAQ83267.1 hypothetical protein KFL_001410240 [Klebsormidium nitens]
MAGYRRAGIADFLDSLCDQAELLRAFYRPRLVFLLCVFLCPFFLGFTTLALFGHILALAYFWALYLAFVLPLPIAVFLAWYLFAEMIPGEIIADVTSEATPRVYPTWEVQQTAAPRGPSLWDRRQALRERLLEMCDENFLERRVAQLARGYRVTDVRLNAHLQRSSYMLDRFLDTLLQHEDTLPDLWEELRSSPGLGPFVVAFHGTPPANIPSILAHGLLPTSRVSDPLCDYFSTDLAVTRRYVDKTNRLWYRNWPAQFQAVVFLLLKKEPAVVDHFSFIVMRHAAYQLPLGVVTVEADYGPQEF